jgi:hypothetical protein
MRRAILPLIVGLLMAALPFGEQPHLIQKWKLFINGWLNQPLDWFDFALHGLPLVGAVIYTLYLALRLRRKAAA